MSADNPAEVERISAPDRLSLAIGRAVQADVWMEWQLRHLFQVLCGASLASSVVPDDFSRVRHACNTMLTMAGLPEAWNNAATDVLKDAEDAHSRRNRLVHDLLLLKLDESAEGPASVQVTASRIRPNALRTTVSDHELADLEDLPEQIRRVSGRIGFLGFALPHIATFLLPGPLPPWNEKEQLRWVRGEFEMLPDGGMRLQDT